MNGLLLIDKPSGMTSRDVVNIVSSILKTRKIGHTGTLDPIATGVLVLCVGKSTKISELITGYDKEYAAEVTLGIETDTLDITGKVLNEEKVFDISEKDIENVLTHFIGNIEQEVPAYSAIKVNGRKLYDYARKNTKVEMPKRHISIYELSLISNLYTVDGQIRFKIKCHVSKGTYIRSLVRDIGKELNTYATMSSLRRIKQGPFKIEDCSTIEEVKNGNYKLYSINEILNGMEEVVVSGEIEKLVKNGAHINKNFAGNMAKMVSSNGELIAIYKTSDKDDQTAIPYKMLFN